MSVRAGLLAACALLVACGDREIAGTTCATDTDCNLFNAQGTCEATGFCSYPDPGCVSGQRYAPAAGDALANTCVGEAACGGLDQTCCGGSVCGANLTCAIESTTCQCGAAGQPCCDGTTCGDGLRCGGAGVCTPEGVLDVAVGAHHVCARTADDVVWCWGLDFKVFGQVAGLSSTVIDSLTPRRIENLSSVAELVGGEYHTCARKTDGTLWCWGHNEAGQLGNGMTASTIEPVQVSGLSDVTAVSAGRLHTCAIGTVGGVTGAYCWGRGGTENRGNTAALGGRLGNGAITDASVPMPVNLAQASAAGQTVKLIAAGNYHSCVVMSDDSVWCWGRNNNGQLGDGTTTATRVPVQANLANITIPTGGTIDEISCNDGRRKNGNTCIRLSNGTIYCWGYNGSGQLGDGSTTQRTTPSLPVDADEFGDGKPVALAAGFSARCARTDLGELFCWGSHNNGAVGNGASAGGTFRTPQKLSLTGVTHVDASHSSACAIDGDKRLWCWGANRRGNVTAREPLLDETAIVEPFHVEL